MTEERKRRRVDVARSRQPVVLETTAWRDLILQFSSFVDIVRLRRTGWLFRDLDISTSVGLPWTMDETKTSAERRVLQLNALIDRAVDAVEHGGDDRVLRDAYKQAIQMRIENLQNLTLEEAKYLWQSDPARRMIATASGWWFEDMHGPLAQKRFFVEEPLLFDKGNIEVLLSIDYPHYPEAFHHVVLSLIKSEVHSDKEILRVLNRKVGWFQATTLRVMELSQPTNSSAAARARRLLQTRVKEEEYYSSSKMRSLESFGVNESNAANVWEFAGLDIADTKRLTEAGPYFAIQCALYKKARPWTLDEWFQAFSSGLWPHVSRTDVDNCDFFNGPAENKELFLAAYVLWSDTVTLEPHEVKFALAYEFTKAVLVRLAAYIGPEAKRIQTALVPFLVAAVRQGRDYSSPLWSGPIRVSDATRASVNKKALAIAFEKAKEDPTLTKRERTTLDCFVLGLCYDDVRIKEMFASWRTEGKEGTT